jgi:CrcB protein
MTALLVALGAAVGAPLRYLISRAIVAPWATLVVNVAGSSLLGFLIALPAPKPWLALLGTGFCGALTTYSTVAWEIVTLARDEKRPWPAIRYATTTIAAGLAAAALGYFLAP